MFGRRKPLSPIRDFLNAERHVIRRHVALKVNPACRNPSASFDRVSGELTSRFRHDRTTARIQLFDALLRDLSVD